MGELEGSSKSFQISPPTLQYVTPKALSFAKGDGHFMFKYKYSASAYRRDFVIYQ